MFSFAISFYILSHTNSSMQFTLSLMINYFPKVFASPLAGLLNDKTSKKSVLAFSLGANALCALIPICTNFVLPGIYLTIFLMSISSVLFSVSFDASIPFFVEDNTYKKFGQVASYGQLIISFLGIITYFLSGIVFEYVTIYYFALLDGLLSLLCVCMVRYLSLFKTSTHNYSQKDSEQKFVHVMKYIARESWALRIVAMECLFNFLLAFGVMTIYQMVIVNVWGLSAKCLGLFSGIDVAGIFVASVVMRRKSTSSECKKTLPYKLLMLYSIVILASSAVIYCGNKYVVSICFIILCCLQFGRGLMGGMLNVTIVSLKQFFFPSSLLGRALGIMNALSISMIPFGLALSGSIMLNIPVFVLPLISGSIMFIITAIGMTHEYVTGNAGSINT